MTHGAPISADATKTKWRTSSYSGGQGNCLEVADNVPHHVPVRDSKRPTGPLLGFSHNAWSTFLTHLT